MALDSIVAAAPVVQMQSNPNSWFGNAGSAFVGVAFLLSAFMLARSDEAKGIKPKGPWGPWLAKKLDHVKWDWKSLMSCLWGFFGTTALLGSVGVLGNLSRWFQGLFSWIKDIEFIANVGMAGVCLFILLMVWRRQNDNISDVRWGCVMGLAFPLGGGIWLQASLAVGNMLVNIMNGIPRA
jgi:hypothetical protein